MSAHLRTLTNGRNNMKICVQCIYHRDAIDDPEIAEGCVHPLAIHDKVTGAAIFDNDTGMCCYHTRSHMGVCGPEGRLFTRKVD